jgi:hypothetical protein
MGQSAVLQALAEYQTKVDNLVKELQAERKKTAALGRGLVFIARQAGLEQHLAAHLGVRITADESNPAQPVPAPPSEPATTTTDEARGTPEPESELFDPGLVPGSTDNVPADAVTQVMSRQRRTAEEVLPVQPADSVDVERPVAGTEDPLPTDQVRTEVNVEAQEPTDDVAFPLQGPFTEQQKVTSSNSRFVAAMRLARLRVATKVAQGDEIIIAQSIHDSDMPDLAIDNEIRTLESVRTAAQQQQPSAEQRRLVPRTAGAEGATRSAPSFQSQAPGGALGQGVTAAVTDDEILWD